MKRKTLSGTALTLLLISMLGLAFDVKSASASLLVNNIDTVLNTPIVTETPSNATYQVTLVTGDVVIVTDLSDGRKGIGIIPADPTELGQSFQTFETPKGTYVIPSDVNLDKLDIELFNIDYLISEGFYNAADLPIIVSTLGFSEQTMRSIESDMKGFSGRITASFPRLSASAVQLPLATIKDSIQTLLERPDVEKIRLDKRMHMSLSESVPLIGAPELWDAGYNGSEIEIAILDTGIDETHPDLDDLDDDPSTTDPKVIRAVDFTDDFTTDDLYGHGTHCAGIAAGTGAASADPTVGTYVWFSGADNNLDNTLDQDFDLTMVSSATLRFHTLYETEVWWDYCYVKVSTDGGLTWVVLDIYNGYSGELFEEKTYDLTPFVGNNVTIRFQYVTDFSVVYRGWYIDNIEIPEIGFSDDVESGPGGWTAMGWSIFEFPRKRGVAPGALLWNVKVLNRYGVGYESWIISGIEYATYGPDGIANTGDEADIISMSLGGPPTDGTDPLSLAVNAAVEAGVVVMVAAGNDYDYFKIGSPGVASKVITVGATDKYDNIAYFSSKGPTIDFRVKPDLVAPGVGITSCVPYSFYGTYYLSASGTSMATPHVAGTAALMLQKGVPSGWSAPQYVKDALISTAVDLGYDVYTQGGGRIYVPSAAYTQILVDPATVSFGRYTEDTLDNATLTFYNLNTTSNRILTLDVTVFDIRTGTPVDCAILNTTSLDIAANSSASVLLSINTTVPKSTYSGKVSANIDVGETVHAIFGFSKLNVVTVTKVDRKGKPAAYDFFMIGDIASPERIFGVLDEYGNATVYLRDGTYHVVSDGADFDTESAVYTIAENVPITSDTVVYLDERNTVPIDLNTNKPNQIIAEKTADLFYEGEYWSLWWSYLWDYPKSALTYISPTSFNTGFIYGYYPKAFAFANTPEWHNIVFTLEEVTGATTFVADYDALVQRTTDYKVATAPGVIGRALKAQWVWYPPWQGFVVAYLREMDVPQSRVEWYSPEPVMYSEWYLEPSYAWSFDIPWQSYSLGPKYIAFGEHPFTSGAQIYLWEGYMSVSGCISTDTFGNMFANYTRSVSGNLIIMQDGVKVRETEIWDQFYESTSFVGTPNFTVIIEGSCGLDLSTATRTELRFIANTTQDHQPPRVTMRPPALSPRLRSRSDLYCTVPAGEVGVDVTVSDESLVPVVGLEYSLDDGLTWITATEVFKFDDTHRFSLGKLSNTYVSIRANATDLSGNSVSQTTIRGLRVARAIEGDINADGIVDIFDLRICGKAFGSMAENDPTTPINETLNWNPIVDLNNDGLIDIFDLRKIAKHYLEHV